jgi:hypothetical protein
MIFMAIDKYSSADLVKTGQQYAHELTDGSTTGNINNKIFNIDEKLKSVSDLAQRQQILAAMDSELADKGILPGALKVFAEQTDNHDILKADRRGMHADTLSYNLDPTDDSNARKLKNGHWDATQNPVEMMLTRDLLNNIDKITPSQDNDEITYGRLNNFAQQAESHNADVSGATSMLKEFDNPAGFYGLSHNDSKIRKDYIQNALDFPQGQEATDKPTLQWMKDNFNKISDHGGVTPASMRRYAEENGINVAAVEATQTPPAVKPDAVPHLQDKPLPTKVADTKAVDEQKAAAAILQKDTHVVKAETLQSIAISELQAEGKLSQTATAHDIALAQKQIAYEEHLIRLYTPKIFAQLPNYNGQLQDKWVLNLVPQVRMQQELTQSKLKFEQPAVKTSF